MVTKYQNEDMQFIACLVCCKNGSRRQRCITQPLNNFRRTQCMPLPAGHSRSVPASLADFWFPGQVSLPSEASFIAFRGKYHSLLHHKNQLRQERAVTDSFYHCCAWLVVKQALQQDMTQTATDRPKLARSTLQHNPIRIHAF